MKTTIFKKDITLGKLDGETVKLASPSWDCGWYWGFWYIQNRNIHTHFDSFDRENNRNLFDSIKERFTEWKLDENDTWTFCELMRSFYTLSNTAEVFRRGSSNYGYNPCSSLIINKQEAERINNVVLPAIFDEIYKLFNK